MTIITLPKFRVCQWDSLRDEWHDVLLIRQLDMVNPDFLTFCELKMPILEAGITLRMCYHGFRLASHQNPHMSSHLFYVTQSLHLVIAAPNRLRAFPVLLTVCRSP